jgi:hypothetical protein
MCGIRTKIIKIKKTKTVEAKKGKCLQEALGSHSCISTCLEDVHPSGNLKIVYSEMLWFAFSHS